MTNFRETDCGGGWKIRQFPNNVSRKNRHSQYFYEGKRAPRIPMRSKLSQNLAGYTLIEKDLRNVLIWLDIIDSIYPEKDRPKSNYIVKNHQKHDLVRGLWVAAVVFYVKCFTQCEGRKVKLHKQNLDRYYWKADDTIMSARNNYVAHSGSDEFEVANIFLALPPQKKSQEEPKLFREVMQADMIIDNEEEVFRTLATYVREVVFKKMEELENKIFREEIYPKGKNYWYKRDKKKKFK